MKKMLVLLVHGTWAGAARWTHPGSLFRERLEKGVHELGYEVDYRLFPWNGKNRWRARVEVSESVNEHLDKVLEKQETELLIIAHSHGGNIATEAVRTRLRSDPEIPLRGVVCLNTPFLTHQLRGSSGFLPVWLLVAFVLVIGLWITGYGNEQVGPIGAVGPIAGKFYNLHNTDLQIGLVSVFSVTGGLFLISKYIQRKESRFPWEPRPRVLCLSCPDDEAITFLGLGEGIANLPQLLLHPVSMALFWISALLLLLLFGGWTWCGNDFACWEPQVGTLSVLFIMWLGLALVGGVAGTLLMTLMFGLSARQALRTLVSRVLVSYVPLRPAKSHFRGISDLPIKWRPIQLFHSGIYESLQTVDEICVWLKRYPK